MKKLIFFSIFTFFLGMFTFVNADEIAPGRIIVDIRHQYLPITPTLNPMGIILTNIPSIDSLNVLFRVYSFEKIYQGKWSAVKGYYLLKFPDSLDVNQVVYAFSNDPHFLAVCPDARIQFDVTPVDSFYPKEWGLRKIKCPEAWRYTSGTRSINIEIIDVCVDYGHPDLVHNIWQNNRQWPDGEDADGDGHTIEWDSSQNKWVFDPGDLNGYDDDYNGYPDDLVGWNFGGNPPDWIPNNYPACESLGVYGGDHGDHTSGTAAASTNNYILPEEATQVCSNWTGTVAGTSWFSKIMAARVSGYYINECVAAIAYGIDNGAKIISMSWGYDQDFPNLHNEIDSAWNEGLLLVASAGNTRTEAFHYPAAYPNVIAVAGTDSSDVKDSMSNYGTWVDICAPWDNWSPGRIGKWWTYCYWSIGGTSISAPFVSGVAALVWSCNLSATNAQVKNAILSTADNIYNIPGNYPYIGKLGSGRVNALEAVKIFRPNPPPPGECNSLRVIVIQTW
jgi:hypothetical protein